jgi:hypothetical protein
MAAVDDGRLTAASPSRPLWTRPSDAPVSTPAILQLDHRGCVFYETHGAGRCRIHRSLGHDALPLACRQFPRVSLLDPRGASVTLSHYCPTAAGLLDESIAIAITDNSPAFSGREVVGLDTRTSLPPLLAPNMLMSWEAWWEWERRAVEMIARTDLAPAEALVLLHAAVEDLRRWSPRDGPLLDRIGASFRRAAHQPDGGIVLRRTIDDVLTAIPVELRPRRLERVGPPTDAAMRGFLAAHAFANWTAHLGHGLRSWLRSVETAWVLASAMGVRQADLLLRHLADPTELAAVWSRAESENGR